MSEFPPRPNLPVQSTSNTALVYSRDVTSEPAPLDKFSYDVKNYLFHKAYLLTVTGSTLILTVNKGSELLIYGLSFGLRNTGAVQARFYLLTAKLGYQFFGEVEANAVANVNVTFKTPIRIREEGLYINRSGLLDLIVGISIQGILKPIEQ